MSAALTNDLVDVVGQPSQMAYLKKYGSASKQDLAGLILDKLSDVLDEKQKANKLRNLLYAMSKRDKTIEKSDKKRKGRWVLVLDNKSKI